ncbi:MAG: hypothetical protein PHG48_03500 [Eubacteriales bacterium]|nr:hypothetical protein [Eubacteriales bacterium]
MVQIRNGKLVPPTSYFTYPASASSESAFSRASLFGISGRPPVVSDGIRTFFLTGLVEQDRVKSKTDLQKSLYMLDHYTSLSLNSEYHIYPQELTPLQAESLSNGLVTLYKMPDKTAFESSLADKPSRIAAYDKLPLRIRPDYSVFSGPFSYGSVYIGPWDMWFLLRASDEFWFNHWDEIAPYKEYFNQADFEARDSAVKSMMQSGSTPDALMLEQVFSADLQFSEQYIARHLDRIYFTSKYMSQSGNSFTMLFTIALIIAALILLIRHMPGSALRRRYSVRQKYY